MPCDAAVCTGFHNNIRLDGLSTVCGNWFFTTRYSSSINACCFDAYSAVAAVVVGFREYENMHADCCFVRYVVNNAYMPRNPREYRTHGSDTFWGFGAPSPERNSSSAPTWYSVWYNRLTCIHAVPSRILERIEHHTQQVLC